MDTINKTTITTHSDVLSRNRGRRLTKTLTVLNIVLFIISMIVTFPFVMIDFISMSDMWLTSNFGALKEVTSQTLIEVPVVNALYTISYLLLYFFEIYSIITLIGQKSYSKIILSITPVLIVLVSVVFPITEMGVFNGGSNSGSGFTARGLIVYIILNLIYSVTIYVTVGFICKNKDVKQLFVSDKVKYARMKSEMNDTVTDDAEKAIENETSTVEDNETSTVEDNEASPVEDNEVSPVEESVLK